MKENIQYCSRCASYTPMVNVISGDRIWLTCSLCHTHKPRKSKHEQYNLYAYSGWILFIGVATPLIYSRLVNFFK